MGKCIDDSYLVELGYWVSYDRKIFKRNIFLPDVLFDKVIKERYGNIGIFKTAYMYDTDDLSEAYLYGDFYLDFDHDDYNKVKEDVLDTITIIRSIFTIDTWGIKIYYSGNKGIHLIIDKNIFGIMPDKQLNVTFKYIADLIKAQTKNKTIDTKIYDNKRLFRVPNSRHEKSNLFKIPLSYNELVLYNEQQVKEKARSQRYFEYEQAQKNDIANKIFNKMHDKALEEYNSLITEEHINNTKKIIRDIPPCVKHILEVGPIDGTKNQTLSALTSFYKTKGCSYEEAYSLAWEWSNGLISKSEFTNTFNSIYKRSFKYGCRTFKDISECDFYNCPLMKGRIKNVQDNKTINL